jgi:hypothetical protein
MRFGSAFDDYEIGPTMCAYSPMAIRALALRNTIRLGEADPGVNEDDGGWVQLTSKQIETILRCSTDVCVAKEIPCVAKLRNWTEARISRMQTLERSLPCTNSFRTRLSKKLSPVDHALAHRTA